MPELPEVESVRRSLLPVLVGSRIRRVELRRADVVTGPSSRAALLEGYRVRDIQRHGKELLITTAGGVSRRHQHKSRAHELDPCVTVHLGMTGSLCLYPIKRVQDACDRHVHVVWGLDGNSSLVFRDPRRFGGVWTFPSSAAARAIRFGRLGPDALKISPSTLHRRLKHTVRAIKSVLLDQHVLAGVGNIYADELLFALCLHPETPADCLDLATTRQLVRKLRHLLTQAIAGNGSTLRDYRNGLGAPGWYQTNHRAYSRAGLPCTICRTALTATQVSGRTSTFCPSCQRHRSR